MTRHFYDDETLTLVTKIDGTPAAVARISTVDFVVLTRQPGAAEVAEAPHTENVRAGSGGSEASYVYTPTAVADDKDSYDLRYEARITPPGASSPLVKQCADTYTLWPSSAEVTFTSADNDAHKSCRFTVKQRSRSSAAKTAAADGKWTERLDKGSELDQSCTLQAISTEPPPERINLPPKGELELPCQWFANTRLVDPKSYVGSECTDFPALAPGRYRSVFVISGGRGSSREVSVEIVVK